MEAKSHLPSDRLRLKGLSPSSNPVSSYNYSYPGDEEDRLPPPIDPAVFRGVTEIRKLVDEASDLAVRAASGMSAAALGAMNPNSFGSVASALGMEGGGGLGGRNTAMSPIRQHRLRSLAVSKLAEAYRIDEIAASVAVMQGATGLDDLASRVLKNDPDCMDAMYVHFFHEKIPSRLVSSFSLLLSFELVS